MTQHAIIGHWQKTTQSPCSAVYPDHLEFRAGKLYFGHSNTRGAFMQWDAGSYDIIDAAHIAISTANDAIINYQFTIDGPILNFIDPSGCKFSYQWSDDEWPTPS